MVSTSPAEGLCSEGETCEFDLSCGIDGRCRVSCSDESDCPRNEHQCIAGACVGEGESGFDETWGACTEGSTSCNDDYSKVRTCNLSQPGWGAGVACPDTQPFCPEGADPNCTTCAAAADQTFQQADVNACLADEVCAACMESQQADCEDNEPYRQLVAPICDTSAFSTAWAEFMCCDPSCTWDGEPCDSTTLCCGGAFCQEGICAI